jgi:hypothetical protein
MQITSQNLEEKKSKFSDEFVNYWVPVIRKFRETTQWAGMQMQPSMNECVDILERAIHTWEMKIIIELLRGLVDAHAIKKDEKWWEDNKSLIYAHAEIYDMVVTLVEAHEEGKEELWWNLNGEQLRELIKEDEDDPTH